MKLRSIAEILAAQKNPEVALSRLPENADRQGWHSDHPVFDRLVAETQPEAIIEVGTWKGCGAAHLAATSASVAHHDEVSGVRVVSPSRVYCVDTWLGGIDHVLSDKPVDNLFPDAFGSPRLYHQFIRNFADGAWAQLAPRIYPIQNTSLNGARLLSALGVRAGLIYIDGSHEYEDVYADLLAYSQLLTPGGVMFGDDFRGFPGVFTAVLRFAHETGRKLEEIDNNFWILRES